MCFGLTPELRKLTPDGPGYSGCQAFAFAIGSMKPRHEGRSQSPLSFSTAEFALIASQKSHDTLCFCLYRTIISGRELVCAKKNLKPILKRIGRFLIATPRGRRTYRENRLNRWLITRPCAVPQAKPAVSEEPGFSLLYI